MWFLAWWPHALANGINPLHTDLLWAPWGITVTAGTPIPGLALPAAPITLLAGPVVAYNVLALLAPVASAWAGFLLFRHLSGRFWPAVAGGYVYGFSTYELGRLLGHLNLAWTPLVPLAVLLVLRRLEGGLARRWFVGLLAAALVGQALISPEVLFGLTLFGGAALALGFLLGPDHRPRLGSVLPEVAAGYALAGLVLSPYLVVAVARGLAESPVYDFYPTFYSIDALNLIVPTELTRFGRGSFGEVAATFSGNLSEQAGYVGVPLALLAVLFVAERRGDPSGKLLGALLALTTVAAWGPRLHLAGTETITLPWAAMLHVPLARYALPARFMLFASLVLGAMTALWLSRDGTRRGLRWGLVVLALGALVPNSSSPVWQTEANVPAFFAEGLHARYLAPGEIVLVIPYGNQGHSMLWQAEAGLSFRMAGGYVTVVPPEEFSRWPILHTLYTGELIHGYREELKAFVGANGITSVVVAESDAGPWRRLLAPLGVAPVRVGGVLYYRVPDAVLEAYRDARPPAA